MTNIDSTTRFLMGLQQQLAASARTAGVARAAPARTESSGKKTAGATVRDRQGLIFERIRAIEETDPQGSRKAFRIYLESVLADEFGMDLLNDPAYHRIVDQVHSAMDRDSAVAASIEQAGDYLLQASRKR